MTADTYLSLFSGIGGLDLGLDRAGWTCVGQVEREPFSRAGRRRGVGDERWGWPWMFDVIREVRPQYVLVENVPALLDDADAFGWVLGDLASLGLDAEWSVLSACAVGAPHTRERLFVVAHANGLDGAQRVGIERADAAVPGRDLPAGAWPDPENRPVEIATRGLRVADGPSGGLDAARVRGVGNAVVPQLGERIGRLILAAERAGVSS